MKPILFATNYSDASENAGDYAAQLAELCNVPLIVLHTWTLPVLTSQDVVAAPPPERFHEREQHAIDREVMRLRTRWNIDVRGIECQGYTPDEIEKLYNKEEISLVVMGTHPLNFRTRLSGSVATTSIHHAGYPMLLVPDKILFHRPERILFAADKDFSSYSRSLTPLKLFVRTMNATLDIVQVLAPDELWELRENDSVINLEIQLRQVPHQWNTEYEEDITEGILRSSGKLNADWIAVTPRHFTWLKSLFTRSITKELVFTTNKPLLILPSEEKINYVKPHHSKIKMNL